MNGDSTSTGLGEALSTAKPKMFRDSPIKS
jgi:hypothetical protein